MPLLKIGAKAPSFELRDQHGESHWLKQYAGRAIVLYFYPKDDTSDCTAQACQFRDHHPDFSKLKATVLGISPDPEPSHAAFAAKHGLDFPILADSGDDGKNRGKVCAKYGVWAEKSMYGKKYMGVVRTTYLIDAKGVVRARWDKVKVKGHAAEVLDALRTLLDTAPRNSGKAKLRKGARDTNPPYGPVRGSRSKANNATRSKAVGSRR